MNNENLDHKTTSDDQQVKHHDLRPDQISDDCWDALVPDEDQKDLLPEPGDFWIEDDLLEANRPAA